MPFSLDLIRKLNQSGVRTYAADTFFSAPGCRSNHTYQSFKTSSPRFQTKLFIQEIKDLVEAHDIECIIPSFEEAFYLADHRDELGAPLMCPDKDLLLLLHDKDRFTSWVAEQENLKEYLPKTLKVTNQDDLKDAANHLGDYFAKPVFSRGGSKMVSNCGPIADQTSLNSIYPTERQPWLVQEFVNGQDLCTYSLVQNGSVQAHSAYVHPREIEHAGGIVFESIDDPEALKFAQEVASLINYTGHISFDFMRTENGLKIIECNPRPTAGLIVMPTSQFLMGMADLVDEPLVTPSGRRFKYSSALLRNLFLYPKEFKQDWQHLLSDAKDVYFQFNDPMPAFWQLVSYLKVIEYRRITKSKKKTDLMDAYFYDILFDELQDENYCNPKPTPSDNSPQESA